MQPRPPTTRSPPRPVELGALRSDRRSERRGETWVNRHVSANGVICVSWQQICVGATTRAPTSTSTSGPNYYKSGAARN